MYGILALIRLVVYFFRYLLNAIRSQRWPRAEAIVTADPTRVTVLAGFTVEIPYSYRFQGELYTGLIEVPTYGGSAQMMERFPKGSRFLVRVNPAQPEVSVVRDRDQANDIQQRVERVDELQSRRFAQK